MDNKNNGDETHEHPSALQSVGLEFLLSGENKVPFSSLEGKVTCLFFSANWSIPCQNFMPHLLQLYNTLNKQMEIIFVSLDRDEAAFMESFKQMPWLAAPFDPDARRRLCRRCHIKHIPSFISFSTTSTCEEEEEEEEEEDVVQLIKDYGVDAFPFDAETRSQELKAIDEGKREEGSLQDLLGSKLRNYLISSHGAKVPISELVGKTIGLYFGAHWCPPCLDFANIHLLETYNELKAASRKFEIVFISSDKDEDGFKTSMSEMPWLGVPYQERSRHDLSRIYNVKEIPSLVIIGPDGKELSTINGRAAVTCYGALAFPFTATRVAELETIMRIEGEGLVGEVRDWRHEHELKLDKAMAYVCDGCGQRGRHWVFSCYQCDFDLHPSCVQLTTVL